jgi:integrase
MVSQIFGIKGGREKFDYVNGGRKAWVAKIDRIKLADVTPDKVNKWRIAFVKKAGENPLKQRRARISCNSIMRQAKSLFAQKLLAHVTMQKPDKLPFDGVAFYKRESMRYQSTVNINALVSDAVRELPHEQLKIFLLGAMAGLAHNEIDKLQWQAFRWNDGVIRIETTKHFTPKSSHRTGDVPIDQELAALFRGWYARATGSFVIEGGEPNLDAKHTHYRAKKHFDALLVWLRSKGVTGPKPLHELRKEFGSQICAKHGIYAASRMLRHGGISITAEHYLDQKGRVTLGMGNLLVMPDNVTPMGDGGGAVGAAPAIKPGTPKRDASKIRLLPRKDKV